MRWIGRLLVAGACWSSRVVAAPPPVAPEALSPQVSLSAERALIDEGIALRKAEDDRGARAAFSQAWALGGSPEALAQLALAEQALGLWVEAHEHLSAALEHAEHSWISQHRPTLEAALTEIASRLGRLEVSCNVVGAQVSLDGRVVGETPLEVPLHLLAGRSVIQVSALGYFDVSRQVQIDAGALSRLNVTLTPNSPPPLPALAITQTPSATEARRPSDDEASSKRAPTSTADPRAAGLGARDVLKYGSLGLAALGITVGVTGYVMREVNVRQYNDDSRCNATQGVRRSRECAGEAAAYRFGEALAIGGFAAAGVFGGVWLYLWFDEQSGQHLVSRNCGIGFDRIVCRLQF